MKNYLLLILLSLFLISCSEQKSDKKEKPNIEMAELTSKAWLRAGLPEQTTLYTRLPNPWFIFSGQDNAFKYALGNKKHVEQIQQIQKGVYDNFLTQVDPVIQAPMNLLFKHTKAPIELAVLSPAKGQPSPLVVFATELDFKSVNDFELMLKEMTQMVPNLQLMNQDNTNGSGEFMLQGGITGLYQFNSTSGKLSIMAGMGATASSLVELNKTLQTPKKHNMHTIEAKIDSSYQGLFTWVNPKLALRSLGNFIPNKAQLESMGLDQINAVGLGYGVSENKTRLKVMMDMPNVGIRQFLPDVNNTLGVTVSGKPKFYGLLSLPTSKDLARFEKAFKELNGQLSPDYVEIKKLTQEHVGISLESILDTVGPEIIFFSDDVADFLAVKIPNKTQFYSVLEKFNQQKGFNYHSVSHKGLKIHHMVFSHTDEEAFQDELNVIPPVALEILKNLKTHVYWIEDGDYAIMASIPQPLIERSNHSEKLVLGDWLKQTQNQDLTGSLLGLGGQVSDMSRTSYHVYLQLLHSLGDLSGGSYDPLAFPTADKLGFPEKGSLGMSFTTQGQMLSLEFLFEQSLSDIFYGGYTTFATVGVLAAVALPAYQDYTIRSKVSNSMVFTGPLKSQISMMLSSGESLESINSDAVEIKTILDSTYFSDGSISVENGTIIINYDSASSTPQIYGHSITLSPQFDDQNNLMNWSCDSTLDTKYLPQSCRY
ncbi:pilin [Pleionea sediminis]|uniref:pilin n=1 Tax=Pleionea sediminis TaxID=2569479 RepID=UPI0013DE599F|nr:pilin [Pleionea sediminis]